MPSPLAPRGNLVPRSEPVHDGPISEHPSIVAARNTDGDAVYGVVVIVLPRLSGGEERVAVAFGPILDDSHAHEVATAAAIGGAPTFWVDLDRADGQTIQRYRYPLPENDGQDLGFPAGQGRDR